MDKKVNSLRTLAADITLNVLLLIAAHDKDGRVYLELLRYLQNRAKELVTRLEELDQ